MPGFAGIAVAAIAILTLHLGLKPPEVGEDGVVMGSGKMFDGVAPQYDLINRVLTMKMDVRWRAKMISSLNLKPGDKVLDVGTGTADVAIALAEHLKKINGQKGLKQGSVVGLDPSEGMLSIGREKVSKAGFTESSIRLVLGDAQDLSTGLPEGVKYDGATMAFVIRNIPDRRKTVREIVARLKGGARLAILELGFPTFPPAKWFVRHCVPFIGWALSGGKRKREYAYLNDSMAKMKLDDLVEIMRDAGLKIVHTSKMNFNSVGLFVGEKAPDPPPLPASPPPSQKEA